MANTVQRILREPAPIVGRPRRVAAYCRVSTCAEGQQSSFETQVSVYREKIVARRDWVLTDIYADEGVTGTSAARRSEFMRMMADCEAGRIDYILTKSISRFARNTLECLSYIRYLQGLGVQIYFERENIDTGLPHSEMLLTILAAFAQEESRSLSENLKWGIRKRFQAGIDRWTNIFGYAQDAQSNYRIVPDQAKVVREIFRLYERGLSMAQVGRRLMQEGICAPKGGCRWDANQVRSILENEKYVGDILLQKCYTVDHLSRRTRKNDQTVVPSYYIRDHHAPIVSRETYERVQRIRGLRSRRGSAVQYPFGDMLCCPRCGVPLVQRKLAIGGRGWICERGPDACRGFLLRSKAVEGAMRRAYAQVDPLRIGGGDARAREAMCSLKCEFPQMPTVEYYWLDALVERIAIEGALQLHVYWRCGIDTAAPLEIAAQDAPDRLAARQWAALERAGARKGGQYAGLSDSADG